MAVNKYKIRISNNDKYLNLPIQMDFDYFGQDEDIDVYQENIQKEIIGRPIDFEVGRFSHSAYTLNNLVTTFINYEFYFFNQFGLISNPSDWHNSYIAANTFTDRDLYYYTKPFTRSFFKIDLYDTPIERSQTNYLTVIIPTQQGQTEILPGPSSFSPFFVDIEVKKPNFILDVIGADKEGYYLYWLRKPQFVNLNTFYMSVKFFDANIGQFISMMTQSQGSFAPGSYYKFDPTKFFYRKVLLDYVNYTYSIFDSTNTRIGLGTPIKWYEYVNPK